MYHESEKIFRTAMSKFMSLNLENSENPDIPFFEADNLLEEVECHEETIAARAYKGTVVHAIPTTYSDVKFAVPGDHPFSLEHIRKTMRWERPALVADKL